MDAPNDMPNPTEEQLESPEFAAIWHVIKTWDVSVPELYEGYCGANGSHVALLLNGLTDVGDAQDDNAKIVMFTVEQLCALVYTACGAASVPFMRDNPGYIMPSEEIQMAVDPILRESGIDTSRVHGYSTEASASIRLPLEDRTRIPDGEPGA